MLEDVDRQHAVEEPVVEGEPLLTVGDEGRDAREALAQAPGERVEQLDGVVLLAPEFLVAELGAEPGADLQRALSGRRGPQRIAVVEALDETALLGQILQ